MRHQSVQRTPRSALLDGKLLWYCPAEQYCQALHDPLLSVEENVPEAHSLQRQTGQVSFVGKIVKLGCKVTRESDTSTYAQVRSDAREGS